MIRKNSRVMCRGLGIYDVKGSVHVFFGKLHHRVERERKGRECKISKQSTQNLGHHNYLDPCKFPLIHKVTY